MSWTNVVIDASAKHTATLIFFHGLGDTGHGWATALNELKRKNLKHVKCICPTASSMPITLNGGASMPSWFDIKGLSPSSEEDSQGIIAASQKVHKLIEDEKRNGIDYDRIALGGFSMGGALALYSALTFSKKLACVIGLSCWLPLRQHFNEKLDKQIPILLCHGDYDNIVPFTWGEETCKYLKKIIPAGDFDINDLIQFKRYGGLDHSSSSKEMNDVAEFIMKHLPAK